MDFEDKTLTEIALKRYCVNLSRILTFFCLLTVPNTKWLFIYFAIYLAALGILTVKYGERTENFKETISD